MHTLYSSTLYWYQYWTVWSTPKFFWVVLLDHCLTLFLCSIWYKSTGIFEKWSQVRIIHFLKQLFRAIWLFETPIRGWNDVYMDYSTDTPTHPSTQYRNALVIRSWTTSWITPTTSYMLVESLSSSLWSNSVTPENQFQPVPGTPYGHHLVEVYWKWSSRFAPPQWLFVLYVWLRNVGVWVGGWWLVVGGWQWPYFLGSCPT